MPESLRQVTDRLLDQQRRALEEGECPSISELLSGTPCVDDPEALLDLLYNEVVVREELGHTPQPAEFIERFPHLRSEIELHFEVHRAVSGERQLETQGGNDATDGALGEARQRAASLPVEEFEIGELLGQGAMADVFRARHRALNRTVALKVFRCGGYLTARHAARIRVEAEVTARLAHPNIVQIFEIGECDGTPYLALELVEDGTLADRLQQFPYSPTAAAELIMKLAEAVRHAHERQVIHRDLKPANVLLAADGTPKISDFGLAKVLRDESADGTEVTRTGETVGTPRYMAPEQAAGAASQIGPATDVYALGALLYECLAGRAPFVAASVPDTLRMILEDDPQPPRRWQPAIPRDLETICLQCLHKDPRRRYASAHALTDDLRRFLRREPIHGRPVPRWEHAWKWCRRKPAQALLVAWGASACLAAIAAAILIPQVEQRRLDGLRFEVATLMSQGQAALSRDELEQAEASFHSAWLKVRGEPSLADHTTSVTGWLDHVRHLSNRSRWQQRVPPRDFDDKRDEALLLATVPAPWQHDPWPAGRDAIRAALELTLPGDRRWEAERSQLILLDSLLLARSGDPSAALAQLEAAQLPSSARRHLVQAELLRDAGRTEEALDAERAAANFPRDAQADLYWQAMDEARAGQYEAAIATCGRLLHVEPEHFAARQLQAVCCVQLKRFAEAEVGLTACVAQRPFAAWCYYYRAVSEVETGQTGLAVEDLQRVLDSRPSAMAADAARAQLTVIRKAAAASDPPGRPSLHLRTAGQRINGSDEE